jgi:hypothetical protein
MPVDFPEGGRRSGSRISLLAIEERHQVGYCGGRLRADRTLRR